jgi:hypothetical protein
MPCYSGTILILPVAWLSVLLLFKVRLRKDRPNQPGTKSTGPTAAELIIGTFAVFSVFFGCMGCYALWPGILLFVAGTISLAGLFQAKVAGGSAWWVVGRGVFTTLTFTLTWYFCATMPSAVMHGFGDRIEAQVGEDRLFTWASEMIAETKPGKEGPITREHVKREEIPDFIHELMGNELERTRVDVVLTSNDSYVTIASSINQALQITVRPSRAPHERGPGPPQWLLRDAAGFEWRPGIYIDTLGNFR